MRRFEAFLSRQRASVRKFYMYYCSIIRLIDNVSMGTSNGKRLVVQLTENLKECEHNMGLYFNGRKLPLQGRGCGFEFRQIHHIYACSQVVRHGTCQTPKGSTRSSLVSGTMTPAFASSNLARCAI